MKNITNIYEDYHKNNFDATELSRQLVEKQTKWIDEHVEQICRTFASPPIKGKITKGKLKWRGLRLIQKNEFEHTTYWVEQRGKKIGYDLTINTKLF